MRYKVFGFLMLTGWVGVCLLLAVAGSVHAADAVMTWDGGGGPIGRGVVSFHVVSAIICLALGAAYVGGKVICSKAASLAQGASWSEYERSMARIDEAVAAREERRKAEKREERRLQRYRGRR